MMTAKKLPAGNWMIFFILLVQISNTNTGMLLANDDSPVTRLQTGNDASEQFVNSQDLSLSNPKKLDDGTIEASGYSRFTNMALIDFTDSLVKIFIKTVGNAEGKMSHAQFSELCDSKKFPISISADEYFSKHDKDHDNQLAISEYVPSKSELISDMDYRTITKAFVEGEEYPNGESPSTNTVEAMGASTATSSKRLYMTSDEIEARFKKFAESIGGQVTTRSDGKPEILDSKGNHIEPPRTIVPPTMDHAITLLQKYADDIGGKVIAEPDKLPIVLGPKGKSIPPLFWPKPLRPPYLKSSGSGN